MLFGASDGRMAIEYTEGAPFYGEEVYPQLSLAEISSKLLKDSVSNYRGRTFSESGGYLPRQNPYAEATVKTMLKSLSKDGYQHISESIATRVFLNLVNVLDRMCDHKSGFTVTYGVGGSFFGVTRDRYEDIFFPARVDCYNRSYGWGAR